MLELGPLAKCLTSIEKMITVINSHVRWERRLRQRIGLHQIGDLTMNVNATSAVPNGETVLFNGIQVGPADLSNDGGLYYNYGPGENWSHDGVVPAIVRFCRVANEESGRVGWSHFTVRDIFPYAEQVDYEVSWFFRPAALARGWIVCVSGAGKTGTYAITPALIERWYREPWKVSRSDH